MKAARMSVTRLIGSWIIYATSIHRMILNPSRGQLPSAVCGVGLNLEIDLVMEPKKYADRSQSTIAVRRSLHRWPASLSTESDMVRTFDALARVWLPITVDRPSMRFRERRPILDHTLLKTLQELGVY